MALVLSVTLSVNHAFSRRFCGASAEIPRTSRRYAPADPPDLLNYEGCELPLIAASDDVEDELGLQLEGGVEVEDGEGENQQAAASCSDLVKMFGEVADVKPLLSGSWESGTRPRLIR